MRDPYQVLDVPQSATDEEIKTAYRSLARKYHPDKYRDSDLADLASEKMKEINEAYDEIKKQRAAGTSSGSRPGGSAYSSGTGQQTYSGYRTDRTYTASELFAYARQLINAGRFAEADQILSAVPTAQHSAEWFFLKGLVSLGYRRFVDAQQCFDYACGLDPENQEYRDAQTRLREQMTANGMGNQAGSSDCSLCDVCTGLLCLNLCCDVRHC